MPILLFLFVALCGVGWFAREEMRPRPVAHTVATIAPARAAWTESCRGELTRAAREFAERSGNSCSPGEVTVTTLPSGAEYVEFSLRTRDGSSYQVSITEEADNDGEQLGWRGAPCYHAYVRPFQVVRHEHGRLGLVSVNSPLGFLFAQTFQPAADACIEQ